MNVTSDVSNQEQESQIDDGHPAQSASSNQILLLLKIIDTIKIDIGKRNQKNATNASEFKAPEEPISDHFTGCTNPIDIFLKYLDTEIIDNILYQSNLYITQK